MMKPLENTRLWLALALTGASIGLVHAPVIDAQETSSDVTQQAPQQAAEAARESAQQSALDQLIEVEELRAEAYERALEAAAMEQRAALDAVESARRQLAQQALEERTRQLQAPERREQAQGESQRAAKRQTLREQEQERRAVQRELKRAHAKLRSASQEVARVHRDLYRDDTVTLAPPHPGAGRALIGIIPGAGAEQGVQVLGLSPNGPAERAGIRRGDVIVALMGEPLDAGGADDRERLFETLRAAKPGDELAVTLLRGGQTIDTTVIAEERTPFTWESMSRLTTAPSPPAVPGKPDAPDAPAPPSTPMTMQAIEVPAPDLQRLEEEIEIIREQLGEQNILIERVMPADDGHGVKYQLEGFSAAGDAALAGTGLWFGMRLTRGLSLAEMSPELGRYFGTDRGVLVLSAPEDNELQLRAGDVILSVDGSAVERPADVMRALRAAPVSTAISIELQRDQQLETFEVTLPEERLGLRVLSTQGHSMIMAD